MILNKNRFSTGNSIFALGIAAAAIALGSAPAHASGATASETVTIEAEIPTMCQFDGTGFGQINITNLMNGRPAGTFSKAEATASVTCNTAADVELESTYAGLVHKGVHIAETGSPASEDPLGGDYLTRFDYIADLKDGGTSVVNLDTASGTTLASVTSAFGGMPTNKQLTLEIVPAEVTGVLQAGTYKDELIVRVIPQN